MMAGGGGLGLLTVGAAGLTVLLTGSSGRVEAAEPRCRMNGVVTIAARILTLQQQQQQILLVLLPYVHSCTVLTQWVTSHFAPTSTRPTNSPQLRRRPTSLPTLPYTETFAVWSIAACSVESQVLIDSRQKFGW